jgi:hypothetical protein
VDKVERQWRKVARNLATAYRSLYEVANDLCGLRTSRRTKDIDRCLALANKVEVFRANMNMDCADECGALVAYEAFEAPRTRPDDTGICNG